MLLLKFFQVVTLKHHFHSVSNSLSFSSRCQSHLIDSSVQHSLVRPASLWKTKDVMISFVGIAYAVPQISQRLPFLYVQQCISSPCKVSLKLFISVMIFSSVNSETHLHCIVSNWTLAYVF